MYKWSDYGFTPFEQVLDEASRGTKAVLACSGGLDSAYLLWAYAKHADHQPIVHHIGIHSGISGRGREEEESLMRQIRYVGGAVYRHSQVQCDQDPPRGLFRDFYLCWLLSIDLARMHGAKYVVIGDDLPNQYFRTRESITAPREQARIELTSLNTFTKAYSNGTIECCVHSESHDLHTLYSQMPKDYTKLAFSCRVPIRKPEYSLACGECSSCQKNKMFHFWDKTCTQLWWRTK